MSAQVRTPRIVYEQPASEFRRRRRVELARTAFLIFSMAAAIGALTWWSLDPTSHWMAPVFTVLLAFVGLLGISVIGRGMFRSRFVVFEDAFAPSYSRPSAFARRLPSIVPFYEVTDVVAAPWDTDPSKIYTAAFELRSGDRIKVRDNDVGQEGVVALLDSWDEWRRHNEPPPPRPGPPRWIVQERRAEFLKGLGLAIVGAGMLAFIALGQPDEPVPSEQLLLMLVILLAVMGFGIWYLFRTLRFYGERLRERQGQQG